MLILNVYGEEDLLQCTTTSTAGPAWIGMFWGPEVVKSPKEGGGNPKEGKKTHVEQIP